MKKQTKDIKFHSPTVKKLLSNFAHVKTLHLRRTFQGEVCLAGINGQSFSRIGKHLNFELTDKDKGLLIELELTERDLETIIHKIHVPWVNKFLYENLPTHRDAMFSRFISFSKDGKIEIHKKTGKSTKNDPRNL